MVLLCAAVLSGCGAPQPEQVELTMWLVGSEAQAKTINALAAPFSQRTGVGVRCEAISWGEAHSKYLTSVAGGVEPDIGTMGLTWGAEFGRLGALVDLRDVYPRQLEAIHHQVVSGLWDSIEQEGRVYGIPFDLSLQVLYYRTDLIPEPPQTWEELAALLGRLRQEGRRMLIDWGNLSWIGYAPFLWQAGGSFYDADHATAALNRLEAVQALEFFRDLYRRYEVPKTSIPVEQGLRTGDFPLVLSGNWKIISLTIGAPEIAGKWSIAQLPRGPSGRRTAFLGGRIMGIFARSPHRDHAWEFLNFLFQPQIQRQLYEAGLQSQDAYLPPNVNGWDALPLEAGLKHVLQQQAQDAKGPPAVRGWTETTHALETAIQRVILQDEDPAAALAVANEAMTEALRAP
jgi:lactose/L-arabinose transport system substrate-binding protein